MRATLALPGSSRAGDRDQEAREAVRLLATIPIPPTRTNASGALYVFDISFIDANTGLYYLADRSNAVIDVIDTRTNSLVRQIPGNFKGFTGNNVTGAEPRARQVDSLNPRRVPRGVIF